MSGGVGIGKEDRGDGWIFDGGGGRARAEMVIIGGMMDNIIFVRAETVIIWGEMRMLGLRGTGSLTDTD